MCPCQVSDAWKSYKVSCSRHTVQLLPFNNCCLCLPLVYLWHKSPWKGFFVAQKLFICQCRNINSHPLVAISFGKTPQNCPWSLDPVITIVTFTLIIFMRHDSKITSETFRVCASHSHSLMSTLCLGLIQRESQCHLVLAELYPCSRVTMG